MSPLRNAVLTSIWWSSRSKCATSAMIVLKESFVETGEKVSLKSIPSFWVKPLATRRALYLSTLPFESLLVLKIHLQPMGFAPSGNGTSSQTLLSCIDLYSSFMASIHFWELELCMAWWKLIGSSSTIPMPSSCSWRNTKKSSGIAFLLSLVDRLNGTGSWGCWVCSSGTITSSWMGGWSTLFGWGSRFASWSMTGIGTCTLSKAIVGIEVDSSSKTMSLTLFLPPNSTSSKNVAVPVSKIDLSVGS